MSASSLRRTFLSVLLGLVCMSLPAQGLALTMADLNAGAAFTTESGLSFFDFVIDSDGIVLGDVEVEILFDGFAYSVSFASRTDPDTGLLIPTTLLLDYGVAGLAPGELVPESGMDGRKKAARKGVYSVGAFSDDTSTTPFAAEGSYFVNEDEGWVHALAIEGESTDGDVVYTAFTEGRKKAARKKASDLPDPERYILTDLFLTGTGQVTASERFPSNPIPEPAATAIFGLGALVMFAAVRRRLSH